MTILHRLILTAVPLVAIAGCSQGTAAPIQLPSKAQATASLAPMSDAATPATVRIPQAPRQISPVFGKPIAKQEEPVIEAADDSEDTPQDDRKLDKMNRKRTQQELKGKQGETRTSKYGASTTGEDSKPAAPAPKTETTRKDDAPVTSTPSPETSTTPVSTTPVTPASSTAGSTAFNVRFGSAHANESRNFKKVTLPSNVPSWFSENDKDGDGQLTMNEWPGDRLEEFTKYDRNHDGIITLEEAMRTVPKAAPVTSVAKAPATPTTTAPATTTPPVATTAAPTVVASPAATSTGNTLSDAEATKQVERLMSFVDANKDGVLDAAEIENTRSVKNVDWKKYDLNRDGKLDKAELIALYKAEGNNMRGGGMGGPPGGGGAWGGGNRSPEEVAKTMFNNMDTNKTGKLTKEQFPAMFRDRFGEMDTNKDGFVDLAEYTAGMSKFMQNRGGMGGGAPGGGGRGGPPGGGGRGNFGGGNDGGGRGGRGFGGPG